MSLFGTITIRLLVQFPLVPSLTKTNIQPIELQPIKLLDHQIIGETIQAMSEREEKLDRLKKIGKHLGAESDSFDEEPE